MKADYKVTIEVDLHTLGDLLLEVEDAYVAAKEHAKEIKGIDKMFIAGTGVLHHLNNVIDVAELRRLTGRTKPEQCIL